MENRRCTAKLYRQFASKYWILGDDAILQAISSYLVKNMVSWYSDGYALSCFKWYEALFRVAWAQPGVLAGFPNSDMLQ